MSRQFVSTKNQTVRMFESDLLEFFSHVHPATPMILYVPVIGWMLYVSSVYRQLPLLLVAVFFVVGILVWTFLEYVIHRWLFHYEPKTGWGKTLHFIAHGVHHDYPNDATRLVMPPVISVPLAIVFYLLFALTLGRFAPATLAGFGFGYVCYDTLHYATHHFAMKRGIWRQLKQYHLRHHYQDDHAGFGVSSPLWDHVFRTTRK
jgi:sterol desaturase/sphingolipid hydroxylase (fatty acid hydroxylase superfamily)